ncbi:hypothetical protein LWI28_007329 [Acer negundo]|uniref:Uncharacterized protein n=1 Tax=Acer negundo TaxID=4023 RepID=A0AAD5JSV5_ACENE|nr:hypothetical protein LWI28_007329 [Acer negundo]
MHLISWHCLQFRIEQKKKNLSGRGGGGGGGGAAGEARSKPNQTKPKPTPTLSKSKEENFVISYKFVPSLAETQQAPICQRAG